MNYLIIYEGKAFYTNWYEHENHYQPGMIVINLLSHEFSDDGISFEPIEQDHL